MKGTTCTANITCSYLPGLKTQCALTYRKHFNVVARKTLAGGFKSPGNASRLMLNGFKTRTTTWGLRPSPNTWTSTLPVQNFFLTMSFPRRWLLFYFELLFSPLNATTHQLATKPLPPSRKREGWSSHVLSQALSPRKKVKSSLI